MGDITIFIEEFTRILSPVKKVIWGRAQKRDDLHEMVAACLLVIQRPIISEKVLSLKEAPNLLPCQQTASQVHKLP